MTNETKLPAVAIVIFGAVGDLTWQKLVLAKVLYGLNKTWGEHTEWVYAMKIT